MCRSSESSNISITNCITCVCITICMSVCIFMSVPKFDLSSPIANRYACRYASLSIDFFHLITWYSINIVSFFSSSNDYFKANSDMPTLPTQRKSEQPMPQLYCQPSRPRPFLPNPLGMFNTSTNNFQMICKKEKKKNRKKCNEKK